MADIIDVRQAVFALGVGSIQVQIVQNLLILYEEEFTEAQCEDMISTCNYIRERFTDPYAQRVFGKTAYDLTQVERYQMWSSESQGGLTISQRQEIHDEWISTSIGLDVVPQQDSDADGKTIFYYIFGVDNVAEKVIRFTTDRGTTPEPIDFGDKLPIIPTTDGLFNTGWVNYFGAPVTSTEWDDLHYLPVFTAVWGEAPEEPEEPEEPKDKHIDLYIPNGNAWVKQDLNKQINGEWVNQQPTDAYQQIGGEWVKIAPNP